MLVKISGADLSKLHTHANILLKCFIIQMPIFPKSKI